MLFTGELRSYIDAGQKALDRLATKLQDTTTEVASPAARTSAQSQRAATTADAVSRSVETMSAATLARELDHLVSQFRV